MPKTSTASPSSARKTGGKTPKFGDLPLAARRKKAAAFIAEIRQGWEGHPKTNAVEVLVKMRRGK